MSLLKWSLAVFIFFPHLMTLLSTGEGPEIKKRKRKPTKTQVLCGRGCLSGSVLTCCSSRRPWFHFLHPHCMAQLPGIWPHDTHVACTYLDVGTHTHTKKRESVFRKANICLFCVCGVCRYTYLCVCTRVCTGTDANVLTCSPPYFFIFLRLDLSLTWSSRLAGL